MGEKTHLNRWELPIPFNKEIIFFDTSNSDRAYEKADGLSVKNDYEALSIAENVLPSLFEHHVSAANIAIIAPYKSQVANIIAHINRSPKCPVKQIDVSTLDSFQGKEYDIIIFSFTRSADHRKAPTVEGRLKFTKVGFLDDARRLNVAFSRAKKKLILIGNARYLSDTRSHFDGGLFNYTELFRRLINLSKDERIGNFINIADRGKSGTRSASKLKLGMLVTGSIESPAVAPQTGHEFGKNVITPSGRLLAPYRNAGKIINDGIKFYKIGAPVSGLVIQGDKPGRLILQLLEPAWFQLVKSHQMASVLKVTVLYNNWAGIKVKTESGITGTIMSSDFAKGQLPAKNTKLSVKVVTYDIQSKTIEFKLQV